MQRLPKQGLVFSETKTHRANRAVSLSEESLEMLRSLKATRTSLLVKASLAVHDDDLIFIQDKGSAIDPQLLAHWFKKLAEEAGHPELTFYDLRHASATYLLKANGHPKVVQERLGHANVNITLNTYSHVLPDLHPEAAELLSRALRLDDDAETAG